MTGAFETRLVAFALLLAFFTWFVALSFTERVTHARGAAARAWLISGAFIVGAGVWSAHFTSLLAFQLPIAIDYHVPTLLFTLGLSIVVCFFALWIAGGPHLGLLRLAVAGLCMGLGLAAMHYLALFSLQIVPAIHYDVQRFAGSLGQAFLASWVMLALAYALRQGRTAGRLLARAAAAVLVTIAIGAIFYLGFEAAEFADDSYSLGVGGAEDNAGEIFLRSIVFAAAAGLLVATVAIFVGHGLRLAELARHAGRLELPATPVEHVASPDPLTGLANHALLVQRCLEMRAAAAAGQGPAFALLLADVDHFRHLNERLGATAGDAVLREAAQRLAALVRPGDHVGRPDGDEFALLLADVGGEETLARISTRVREELGRVMQVEDIEVQVAVRVGTALFPRDGEDFDTLLRHARAHLTA